MNIHPPLIFGETSSQGNPLTDFARHVAADPSAMLGALRLAQNIPGAELTGSEVATLSQAGKATPEVAVALGIVASVLAENVLYKVKFDPLTEDVIARTNQKMHERHNARPTSDPNELSRRERQLRLVPLLVYVSRVNQSIGDTSRARYAKAA